MKLMAAIQNSGRNEFIARGQFAIADYVIFVGLIALSLVIGIYVALKGKVTKSAKDFLVGSRTIHPVALALSLLGGVVSAITLLGKH